MKKIICLLIIMSFAGFAMADWDPVDGHKMHYPQLPDPTGWDVNATNPNVLADDWRCIETGWIWDIHIWGSWKNDIVGDIALFHLSVHADITAGTGGIPYSRPGATLWEHDFLQGEFTIRDYGTGTQGWYETILRERTFTPITIISTSTIFPSQLARESRK